MYRDFQALIQARLKQGAPPKRVLVAGAADTHALETVFLAQSSGYVFPLLIGNPDAIREKIAALGFSGRPYEIVPCAVEETPSAVAVRLIREGRGDFILKGNIETRELLKPVLHKETGLNTSGFITHFGLMQISGYHKLLAMSDSAVIPHPTLEEKRKIVSACMDALRKLGYERPVVGALCAVETVSDKMPETQDAKALQDMSNEGVFGDGVVAGPISFDLATSRESAQIKGYSSPYAGNVDMLLVPQMVTGNVMSKIWNAMPDNILAGCLIGADVPIVLTSRSASVSEKLHSILLCGMLS